jgi:peroxiredoxin
MKKLLIPFVIISFILLSSCKSKQNESIENETSTTIIVHGTINEAEGSVLVFEHLTPNKINQIDSVKLDASGNFQFTHETAVSSFYRIVLNNNSIFIVGNPGEKIEVKASAPFISRDYIVTGSSDSKLAQEMNAHLVETADSLQKLNNYYQAEIEKEGANQQTIFNEVNVLAENLFNQDKTYLSELINNNSKSLFIYLALYQSFGRTTIFNYPEDKDMFNFVLSNMEKNHPESGFTKSLKSEISKLEIQQQQESSTQAGFGIGDTPPDIVMENPDGEVKSLHDLRGKYVLLDFWAAWCRPCRMENPNILADYNKYKNDNFTIFQVSLDKTHEDWIKGIKDDNLSQWTHVSDLKYWNNEAARIYGVQSIPASFLLDPEGKIIAKNLRGPALGAKLEEIFGH